LARSGPRRMILAGKQPQARLDFVLEQPEKEKKERRWCGEERPLDRKRGHGMASFVRANREVCSGVHGPLEGTSREKLYSADMVNYT